MIRPSFLRNLTLFVAVLFLTRDFELGDVLVNILVDFLNIRLVMPCAGLALLWVSTSLKWSSERFKFLFHLKFRQIHVKILSLFRLRSSLIPCLLWLLTDFTLPWKRPFVGEALLRSAFCKHWHVLVLFYWILSAHVLRFKCASWSAVLFRLLPIYFCLLLGALFDGKTCLSLLVIDDCCRFNSLVQESLVLLVVLALVSLRGVRWTLKCLCRVWVRLLAHV